MLYLNLTQTNYIVWTLIEVLEVSTVEKILIPLLIIIILFTGCSKRNTYTAADPEINRSGNVYFTVSANYSEIDEDKLLVNEGSSLKLIDLKDKKTIKELSTSDKFGTIGFDISGDIIVWSDLRNDPRDGSQITELADSNADIFMYNTKTSKQMQITINPSSQMNPRVWGNYIIWQDSRNDAVKEYPGRWNLYLYDISTGGEKLICDTLAAHSTINISDNKIVWEDERNFKGDNGLRGGDNVPENNKDIYMYDILTGIETPVATGSLMECRPDISGNYIVYEDRNNGSLNADIVLYDILTKEKTFITKDKYDQGTPRIHGQYIVWMDERRGTSTNDVIINGKKPNSDIFLYNIVTKKETLLTGDEPQMMPVICEKWVAYVNSIQIGGTVDVVEYR